MNTNLHKSNASQKTGAGIETKSSPTFLPATFGTFLEKYKEKNISFNVFSHFVRKICVTFFLGFAKFDLALPRK
jgi:hypothetical protein